MVVLPCLTLEQSFFPILSDRLANLEQSNCTLCVCEEVVEAWPHKCKSLTRNEHKVWVTTIQDEPTDASPQMCLGR